MTKHLHFLRPPLVSFLLLLITGCTPAPPHQQMMPSAYAPASPSSNLVASSSSVSPPLPPLPSLSTSSSVAGINETLASLATETRASTTDYILGPGDLLRITLYNVPESEAGVTPRNTELLVSQQGVIALPLLGDVQASGVTTEALAGELRERYKTYLRDPQIGVVVKEYHSRQISVLGAVHKPGIFELSGPKTLVDLLAMAGGLDEKAGSQVTLSRLGPEGRQSYVIDLTVLSDTPNLLSFAVQAGDVINVPRAGMFFVDGAVNKPGSYILDRPYSLKQALAVAGGVDVSQANASAITIFHRKGSGEFEALSVNMNDILAGEATDPQIRAEDVIVVPLSIPKYIVKRFLGALGMGLSIPVF